LTRVAGARPDPGWQKVAVLARGLPNPLHRRDSAHSDDRGTALWKEGRDRMRSTSNHNCIAQLSLAGLAWVAALALLPFAILEDAYAESAPLTVAGTDITIYDASYVTEHFTHHKGGQLVFTDRSGRPWPLVADPSSSEIYNKGDGKFHVFDPQAVAAACEAISYPLDRLPIEVFILPCPRAGMLDSSCERGAVYLSPGMQEIQQEQAHLVVTHEIGHCVHRSLMPDSDTQSWATYRKLRNLGDDSRYSSSAPHCMRPHEIFAEDFRWLFGGPLSKYSGTIENQELTLPDEVPGLKEFMLSLADVRLARGGDPAPTIMVEISSVPNPFSSTTTVNLKIGQSFSNAGIPASSVRASATVYDVMGRAVKELGVKSHRMGPYVQFRWDGTDSSGRQLPSGVYFLRVHLTPGGANAIHKMLLKR
jgi:hypothetical protein